jgi:STE24 endopeptidase
MHPFTAAFLAALIVATAARFWLAQRHIRHVSERRGSVPAEFDGCIALAAHQKAADYTVAKTRVSILEALVGALMALGFTLGGGLQALSSAWERLFEPAGYAHGIALIVSAGLIAGVVDLPFAWYRTFVVEARFGFNRMTGPLFMADLAKKLALGLAIGIPLLFCVLWLMARMGERWWLYVWLVMIGFNLAVVVLYPSVIAPLFNKFTPLDDAELRHRVEGLLAKCGFRSQGLFVIDSSRRSTHGNAYFWGFGRAKRIVFFDTLLERLAPPEIEAVLAHELGHFKRHHIWKLIALQFIFSLVSLWVLGWLMKNPWFYSALGADSPGTAMALLLFFVAAPSFTFLLHPLASLYSRRQEYEADAYAALQAPARDLVRALVKLYQDNAATLTPDPIHSAFYDSHPPAMLRIARLQNAGTA